MSLRYAVLGILQFKPKHGYEIKQAIEDSFGTTWNVSYGQLYPTLKKLTQSKMVNKNSEPGQKSLEKNVYEITDLGRETFDTWLTETPKKVNITGKDEFSLLLLLHLQNNDSEGIHQVISDQLGFYQEMKDKYVAQLHNVEESKTILPKILLSRIVHRIDAEISWLSELPRS